MKGISLFSHEAQRVRSQDNTVFNIPQANRLASIGDKCWRDTVLIDVDPAAILWMAVSSSTSSDELLLTPRVPHCKYRILAKKAGCF